MNMYYSVLYVKNSVFVKLNQDQGEGDFIQVKRLDAHRVVEVS